MSFEDDVAKGMAFFREMNPEAAAKMAGALDEISPDLMRHAAAFAFGALYQRGGLTKRERQIATLAALAAQGSTPQLKAHVGIARALGLDKGEIAEVFLQLAPYAGFPAAINATLAAKEVFDSEQKEP